jgi:hypothetical protein
MPQSGRRPQHHKRTFCSRAMQTVNRSLPAVTTALGLLAVPIVGVACSSIALGEPLNFALLAATVLIVGGIALGLSDPIVRLYRP